MSKPPFNFEVPVTLGETIWPVVENGYSPVPVCAGEKRPLIYKWQRACKAIPSPKEIERYVQNYSGHGLGLATYRLFVADIDELDPAQADEIEALVRSTLGDTPLRRIGQMPKRQLWYSTDAPIKTRHLHGFDALGTGRFSVAFNTHPKTGQPYLWTDRSPLNTRRNDLPTVNEARVSKLLAKLGPLLNPRIASSESGWVIAARGGNYQSTPTPARYSDELVLDGRDTLLFNLASDLYRRGERDPERLAERAFAEFCRQAEMKRPRSRDGHPWSLSHAREKANWLIKNGEERLIPTEAVIGQAPEWTDERKRLFVDRINAACAAGVLPRSTVAVSHRMLAYVGRDGGCYVTTCRLAADCDLHERTVKAAREQLVKAGFWTAGPCPGREHLALYVPNAAKLSNVEGA